MLLFPNCKINLGLNITRKREDGYHDLETVFYPIAWEDALEGIKQETAGAPAINFSISGSAISGNHSDNLCVKAYHLLQKDFPTLSPIQMHLHKIIPMGAGLGGGSSDGAFALQLINQLCKLNLSILQLRAYALQLGSDCPFFISNRPCFAKGRGEEIEEISLDLSGFSFIIVHPGIHISTKEAFAGITPAIPQKSILEIIQEPVQNWKGLLTNDFEPGIIALYPEIGLIKNSLYQNGALYASMSGSGSAVFGIFPKTAAPAPVFPSGYIVFKTN